MSGLAHFIALTFASFVALFPSAAAAPVLSPAVAAYKTTPHATILFGGDMMFDRTIGSTIQEKGGDFIFSCIDPILRDSDLVVANLEGPITASSSKSIGSTVGAPDNFVFTFPTSTASLLFAHNIKLVNLGNNHILNFGIAGARATATYLSQAHVGYFGLPSEALAKEGDPIAYSVAKEKIKDVSLAFINYNEFSSGGGSAFGGGVASTTVKQIQEARAAGEIPVVYAHWGIEYATSSSAYSRELAHAFIDAGAELVIGSHPHVVQEREFYRGKYIYYSLGNLIFDQYWNSHVTHGLMVNVDVDPTGVQYVQEIPVELMRDRRTCPIEPSGPL